MPGEVDHSDPLGVEDARPMLDDRADRRRQWKSADHAAAHDQLVAAELVHLDRHRSPGQNPVPLAVIDRVVFRVMFPVMFLGMSRVKRLATGHEKNPMEMSLNSLIQRD